MPKMYECSIRKSWFILNFITPGTFTSLPMANPEDRLSHGETQISIITLVNVYVALVVFTRIAGTS